MSTKSQSRHDQLISAGWRYDATQDRYARPGSPTDGTEKWYNQAAAWAAHTATPDQAPDAPQTRAPREKDPRQQEPQ